MTSSAIMRYNPTVRLWKRTQLFSRVDGCENQCVRLGSLVWLPVYQVGFFSDVLEALRPFQRFNQLPEVLCDSASDR